MPILTPLLRWVWVIWLPKLGAIIIQTPRRYIFAAALVSSRLDYVSSVLNGSPSRCLTRLQRIQNSVARIVLQQPSLYLRDTLQQLHWLPVEWRIQLSWLPLPTLLLLPTKSYTPVLHHICLNASISTFLLAFYDRPPLLTCTSVALIFISVHARFILQLQQSGILSLPLFVRLKPFRKHLKTYLFQSACLLLITPSDLSSASHSFYWTIMALNQMLLLTYFAWTQVIWRI